VQDCDDLQYPAAAARLPRSDSAGGLEGAASASAGGGVGGAGHSSAGGDGGGGGGEGAGRRVSHGPYGGGAGGGVLARAAAPACSAAIIFTAKVLWQRRCVNARPALRPRSNAEYALAAADE
jgi:hypothetical protein